MARCLFPEFFVGQGTGQEKNKPLSADRAGSASRDSGECGGTGVIVGVPKESFPGERRVALVPSVIPNLAKVGLEVAVEKGAGVEAGYPDAAYTEKGGKILADRATVFGTADIIAQVLCYGSNDRTGKADIPL